MQLLAREFFEKNMLRGTRRWVFLIAVAMDFVFSGIYMMIATTFYTVKSTCSDSGPWYGRYYDNTQCYHVFCVAFLLLYSINTIINMTILEGRNHIFMIFCKGFLLSVPVCLFINYRIHP
jgi:hypothetical protein